jgi:hypothetical protein
MAKDPFGLGAIDEKRSSAAPVGALTDLSDFQPTDSIPDLSASERRRIDQAANRSGFESREPVEIRRRTRRPTLTQALHTRLRVQDFNRLVAFCESRNIAYAEGVQLLLDHAKVNEIGDSAIK